MDRIAGFPAVWWVLLGLLIGWITMWVMDVVFWRRVPPDRESPPARPEEVEALLRAKARIAELESELTRRSAHTAPELDRPPSEVMERTLAEKDAQIEQLQREIVRLSQSDPAGAIEELRRQVRLLEADKRGLHEQVLRAKEVIQSLEARLFVAERGGRT